MTQKQLGDAIGKAQTWISVLEDPEYGKMSVATLLSLAQAFDTDLEIKFRPFSKALHELVNQDTGYFAVRTFEQELPDLENAATLSWITPDGKWSDILRAAQLLARSEPQTSAIPNMATPSGELPVEPEIPQPEYTLTANPLVESEAMKESSSMLIEISGRNRSRKRSRLTRRKEISWRRRKPPKRAIHSPSTSGGARIMNPCTQTVFTFSQVSGI